MTMTWKRAWHGTNTKGLRTMFGVGILAVLLGSTGCKRPNAEPQEEDSSAVPVVKVTSPKRLTFHRLIEQPAVVEAFEETPIHPMIAGYVEEVSLQIGNRVC